MPAAVTTQPIRLELPFALSQATVNAFLFLEPKPTLIDTGDGSDKVWATLQARLAEQGLVPADLRRVIISHVHVDHFGQAVRLADETDADFFVLDAGYLWLTRFRELWAERLSYYRDIFLPGTGLDDTARDQLLDYSQWVLDNYQGVAPERVACLHAGDMLELGGAAWEILHLPGHASHQSSFYQPDTQTFLASDMLLQRTPTPVIEPPVGNAPRVPALPQFIESLQRVAALEIDMVYPGHGAPFADAHALIERQLARISRRKQECLDHLRAGADTAADLLQRMYPPSEFVNMAGLWMVVGYLDLLELEGRVTLHIDNGVWRYAPVP